GQLQTQVLVRAATPTLPFTEHPAVPVETLEVEQALRHRAMTRLVHPQYAVHALDRTAGAHRPTQHVRDPPIRLRPPPAQPLTHHLLHQVRHMARTRDRTAVRGTRPLPPQPPQSYQRRAQRLVRFGLLQLAVQPVQERPGQLRLEEPTYLGPGSSRD